MNLFKQIILYILLVVESFGNTTLPIIDLRMDECYWAGGANGITGDVEDSSPNLLHGTSRYRANNELNNNKICRAGHFGNIYTDRNLSDAITYPNESVAELNISKDAPFSFTVWVYRENVDNWMAAVIRSSDGLWGDGWGLVHRLNGGKNIEFFVGDYNTYATVNLNSTQWTHIAGTYDGATIRLYKNGKAVKNTTAQTNYVAGSLPISIGDDAKPTSVDDDRWQGDLDELKVWNRLLSDTEIKDIYDFENAGLNYDGTTRECLPCNGADIKAGVWEAISIPSDTRTAPLSVGDIFSDDMNGTIGTDWGIYKRAFSDVDNSSSYVALTLTDNIELGVGYWLASYYDVRWDIDPITTVDYNSTDTGCMGTSCIEIDLVSVTLDSSVDNTSASGPYRYTLNSFTGLTQPIDWADCRFIVTDLSGTNKEVLTPSQADTIGYVNKQIWTYSPSEVGANNNGYTVCDDTSPGGCKLLPFQAFWLEMHGSSKNKIIKLLIPKE